MLGDGLRPANGGIAAAGAGFGRVKVMLSGNMWLTGGVTSFGVSASASILVVFRDFVGSACSYSGRR